jgi:hypothetical protein
MKTQNQRFVKNLSASLLLALGLTSITGCEIPFITKEEDPGSGSTTETTSESSIASQMIGRWRTACAAGPTINSVSQYVRYQIQTNSSGTIWFDAMYYTGSGCTGDSYMVSGVGSLHVGGSTTTPSDGNQIDITVSGTIVWANAAASATYLNSSCGNNWSGVSSYSTPYGGMTCSDTLFSQHASGTMLYNVVVVSGGSTFTMGAWNNNKPGYSSSASIPTTTPMTFIKQ